MPDIFVSDQEIKSGKKFATVADRLLEQRCDGRMRTFNILPRKIRFENQEEEEKIILLLRQHWLTQVHWLIGTFVGLFVPLILTWVPLLNFLPPNYQFIALVGWYLLLIAYVYEQFISWYYQVFIITNQRVIDINFYNLIYKELSEAKIFDLEDVTYRQGGVIRAAFNFGDVVMQTAGAEREFMIESAPAPNRIVKIINELKLEQEHGE